MYDGEERIIPLLPTGPASDPRLPYLEHEAASQRRKKFLGQPCVESHALLARACSPTPDPESCGYVPSGTRKVRKYQQIAWTLDSRLVTDRHCPATGDERWLDPRLNRYEDLLGQTILQDQVFVDFKDVVIPATDGIEFTPCLELFSPPEGTKLDLEPLDLTVVLPEERPIFTQAATTEVPERAPEVAQPASDRLQSTMISPRVPSSKTGRPRSRNTSAETRRSREPSAEAQRSRNASAETRRSREPSSETCRSREPSSEKLKSSETRQTSPHSLVERGGKRRRIGGTKEYEDFMLDMLMDDASPELIDRILSERLDHSEQLENEAKIGTPVISRGASDAEDRANQSDHLGSFVLEKSSSSKDIEEECVRRDVRSAPFQKLDCDPEASFVVDSQSPKSAKSMEPSDLQARTADQKTPPYNPRKPADDPHRQFELFVNGQEDSAGDQDAPHSSMSEGQIRSDDDMSTTSSPPPPPPSSTPPPTPVDETAAVDRTVAAPVPETVPVTPVKETPVVIFGKGWDKKDRSKVVPVTPARALSCEDRELAWCLRTFCHCWTEDNQHLGCVENQEDFMAAVHFRYSGLDDDTVKEGLRAVSKHRNGISSEQYLLRMALFTCELRKILVRRYANNTS